MIALCAFHCNKLMMMCLTRALVNSVFQASTSQQNDGEEEEEEAIRAEADVGEDDGLHRRVQLLKQHLSAK